MHSFIFRHIWSSSGAFWENITWQNLNPNSKRHCNFKCAAFPDILIETYMNSILCDLSHVDVALDWEWEMERTKNIIDFTIYFILVHICVYYNWPSPSWKGSFSLQEKFKAFLEVGNICRAAAIFLFAIIIILVCTFRKCRMDCCLWLMCHSKFFLHIKGGCLWSSCELKGLPFIDWGSILMFACLQMRERISAEEDA